MDINRVELKGRMVTDMTVRKTTKGENWITFTVATNDYTRVTENPHTIATYTSVAVFLPKQVEYLLKVKPHQGVPIWLVGKLSAKTEYKKDIAVTYVSVVASEVSILRQKTLPKKEETPSVPKEMNNDNDF